jgi:SnoaL-like domain
MTHRWFDPPPVRSTEKGRYFAGMHLTTDDRLDILELTARYADALDLLQPHRLRAVFTDDAVWEVVGGAVRLVGLDEIMAFMGRADVHPGAHLMTNVYIDTISTDPQHAGLLVHLRSRGVYPVGPSDRHNPSGVFYGRYDDDVVQTDAGWRIRHRRYQHGS